MVRGDLSPRFLPLNAFSISRHTKWGGDRARDNVFPGPTVALDGPGHSVIQTNCTVNIIDEVDVRKK